MIDGQDEQMEDNDVVEAISRHDVLNVYEYTSAMSFFLADEKVPSNLL